jgi:hypothetical protein
MPRDFSVGEIVLLLLCPVELLLVRGEPMLLFARLRVGQQFNAVGLDVLFHVVALDKPPESKNKESTDVVCKILQNTQLKAGEILK